MITLTYIPIRDSYYREETDEELFSILFDNVEDVVLARLLHCEEHTAAFVKRTLKQYPNERRFTFYEKKDTLR